ncbi:5-formyltetrahydrofolate cyclo-ligase [Propionibacterium australiense]|nr:5-formyltetrahydrofolate cyclo-ligase [Propionibacterium australiense]SYZ33846.1 5-formyltetrahydrofolate cyclo-ligase family [Propionibacterium australiense]VEH92010.1 5-formyltetrahydrofolate cyclo-ligase family protein [Propionibacterium australiense]
MPQLSPDGRTARRLPLDEGTAPGNDPAGRKRAIREATRRARSTVTDAQRRADDRSRARLALELVAHDLAPGSVIACYLSVPGEPDTLELVEALRAAGHRVLVPVLGRLPDGTPRHDVAWAWYEGPQALGPGLWSIPEPTGEALPADALALADLVFVSALGVGLDGSRLGTGGGWYDRALEHARGGVPCWALVNDAEVVDRLPSEPHDHPMSGFVTSSRTKPTPA